MHFAVKRYDSTFRGCSFRRGSAIKKPINTKENGFMDLIRIGQYIAGKRKALGLTQKQLAEKLGVSDKSVSKWERGVSHN